MVLSAPDGALFGRVTVPLKAKVTDWATPGLESSRLPEMVPADALDAILTWISPETDEAGIDKPDDQPIPSRETSNPVGAVTVMLAADARLYVNDCAADTIPWVVANDVIEEATWIVGTNVMLKSSRASPCPIHPDGVVVLL